MAGRITRVFHWILDRIGSVKKYIRQDIRKRPFLNFYLGLFLLVLIIVLSSLLQTPDKEAIPVNPAKDVKLYSVGKAPRMTVQAQIEKTGVVTIVALSGGVVQKIHFHEGDKITKGNTLISLSSNYQGGNAMAVQRQLANNQYQSAVDTFDLQKDLLNKQREIAEKSEDNTEKLRDIGKSSRDRTKELIDLNKSLLDSLNSTLTGLQNGSITPPPGSNSSINEAIVSAQTQKAQLLAGLAQAEGTLASSEYQADSEKPPAELAKLQKDTALKQLDLQEKMLSVNKEAARLQLNLAQVSEALMYPSAPLSGTIQKIFVKEGSVVQPGSQLAVLAQSPEDDPITAIAYVAEDIAVKISKVEESILKINGQSIKEYPYFISTEAVQGNSYAVYYSVPDSLGKYVSDSGYIEIEIPIGYADTTTAATYIPVDAIYQTEDEAYLFVDVKGTAKSRKIVIGNVYGDYISVNKGLADGDKVILTRNVVDGDKIQTLK